MLYKVLKQWVLGPLMSRAYNHRVEGLENLPATGAIIASNHLAFCDSLFIPIALPRQVYFLAKSDYFTGKGPRGALTRWFFTAVGQLPMDRSGGAKSQESLQAGIEKLRAGQYLGIYPEGTRSPDGRLYKAKLGVARLALTAQVPVVPVGQTGTDTVQPAGSNRVHTRAKNGGKITVCTVIGKPLDFSAYYGQADDHAIQRLVADQILDAVAQLSGQERVNLYAGDVKKLMEAENISTAEAISRLHKG